MRHKHLLTVYTLLLGWSDYRNTEQKKKTHKTVCSQCVYG